MIIENPSESPQSTSHLAQTVSFTRFYRPEFDVLRLFAFLSVFLYHCFYNSNALLATRPGSVHALALIARLGLRFGVCLFFFLSSYLITSLLEIEKERTGKIHPGSFYLRRILRIWPLYLTFLVAAFIAGHWWQAAKIEPLRLASFLFLVGNFYFARHGPGALVTTSLWTISIEEQFYLFWPMLCQRLSRRGLVQLCIAICGISLLSAFLLTLGGASQRSLWFDTLPQAQFFAAGALTALWIGKRSFQRAISRSAGWVMVGLLAWFLAQLCLGKTFEAAQPGAALSVLSYALVGIGCAAIFYGFLHLPTWWLRRPLIYLGRISYGMYVFHIAALLLVNRFLFQRLPHFPGELIMAGLLVTIFLAVLSYEFLERPILRWKARLEFVKSRPDDGAERLASTSAL